MAQNKKQTVNFPVTKVPKDHHEYIIASGMSLTEFTRRAISEKIEREKKSNK